jgi:hypothetical protein
MTTWFGGLVVLAVCLLPRSVSISDPDEARRAGWVLCGRRATRGSRRHSWRGLTRVSRSTQTGRVTPTSYQDGHLGRRSRPRLPFIKFQASGSSLGAGQTSKMCRRVGREPARSVPIRPRSRNAKSYAGPVGAARRLDRPRHTRRRSDRADFLGPVTKPRSTQLLLDPLVPGNETCRPANVAWDRTRSPSVGTARPGLVMDPSQNR